VAKCKADKPLKAVAGVFVSKALECCTYLNCDSSRISAGDSPNEKSRQLLWELQNLRPQSYPRQQHLCPTGVQSTVAVEHSTLQHRKEYCVGGCNA
jgi:hypothetical protein